MPSAGFETILCPVDFSELSGHALRQAARLAACGGAKLVALYANWFDAPPYFTEGRIEELTREFRDSQTEAEQSLAAFVKSTLGAPRRTFFDGLVLGTTTLRAVRHAPWPVQTVGERVR
jgi:nucleotide-binding universal stress UspA family protein